MAVVIVFAIYYVYKVMQVQNNVIEGLRNRKSNKSIADMFAEGDVKLLKKANEKLSDTLLISKYKSNYEDMVIDFETTIDMNILFILTTYASRLTDDGMLNISDKTTPSTISTESLQLLNNLYTLKTNLNSTMDFLDSQKSGGALGGLFGGSKSSSSNSNSKSKSSSFF